MRSNGLPSRSVFWEILQAKTTGVVLLIGFVTATLGWILSLPPGTISWGDAAEWVTAFATLAFLAGLYPAYRTVQSGVDAVRAEQRSTQAELIMQFNTEWRSDDLYESSVYINRLRHEWIQTGGRVEDLAKEWLESRLFSDDETMKLQWNLRRRLAQFLRHAGYLLHNGYLEADDVFSIIAEIGRFLEVPIPIENALIAHFDLTNQRSIREWSVTRKWELDELWKAYENWQQTARADRFGPHPRIPVGSYPVGSHREPPCAGADLSGRPTSSAVPRNRPDLRI